MKRLIWSTAAALLLFAAHPAQAQNTLGGKVVTTCGTPGAFPTNGRPGPFTVDVNGKLCTDASGGGGGAATIADGADVAQGTTTDAACAGDATSGCTVLSRLSRIAARLTTLITATGSPFQAGGSIGNTTFAATQGTSPWVVSGTVTAGGVAQASTTSGQTGQLTQCAVTTSAPSYTTAQTDPLSCDTTGNLRVNVVTATGLAQGSTTSGQTGSMIMGAVTTAAPSYTTAQTSPMSLTTAGGLRSDAASWAGTALGTPTNFGTTPGAVVVGSVNAAMFAGTTATVSGSGTATGALRVELPTNGTGIVNAAQGSAALSATNGGFQNILQGNAVLSATNPVFNAAVPTTAGGLSVYFVQPTASDNHVVIKAGAGQVYKVSVTNNSATVNYLRLYNATTGFNGCNSATNLVYQVAIPASTSVGGLSDSWDSGMAFSTGISICVTSAYATTDTTNATASAMSVNIGYK